MHLKTIFMCDEELKIYRKGDVDSWLKLFQWSYCSAKCEVSGWKALIHQALPKRYDFLYAATMYLITKEWYEMV